ncbi:unnamed protein product [Callosobruchus maculatus]|uniref:Uncharacterized protein n=1 Tax=Callosobruchus maculatus TaxID=64391 RepID=A0A653BKR5_CALMS|nr:unnamed protein product [Callosobruchus maculatus]
MIEMSNKALGLIPTKASLLKKTQLDFQVSSHISHKPRKDKTVENSADSAISDNKNDKVYNIKRLKQEIKSFTLQNAENKKEAKIQLAIKLGAKPPKNKYTNYKTLVKEKQKQKQREMKAAAFQQLGKNSHGRCNAKGKSYDRKRKKEKGGILDIYGKVTKD